MKALSGKKTKDLTHGPIAKPLFWFSLPLFAGSLIQQLYSTVDLIFVGQNLGKDAAAAVGASTFIIIIIRLFYRPVRRHRRYSRPRICPRRI